MCAQYATELKWSPLFLFACVHFDGHLCRTELRGGEPGIPRVCFVYVYFDRQLSCRFVYIITYPGML